MLRWAAVILGLLGILLTPDRGAGCGFCCDFRSPTLCSEVRQAHLVFVATVTQREHTADGKPCPPGERTELEILQVLKSGPVLEGRTVVLVRRDIAIEDPKNPPKFLVFCDVWNGQIDPYRGIPFTPQLVSYVQGALAVDPKDRRAQLRYYFDHLGSPDPVVAADAYQELDEASYTERRAALTGKASPDQIVRLLQDPKIPLERRRLFALLLGQCGKKEHAALVRRFLDQPENWKPSWKRWESSATWHAVIGYVMLCPEEGRAYVRDMVQDASIDFAHRFAALQALRFCWNTRPDLIGKEEILERMNRLLDQCDIADLAINDLQEWKCWEVLDHCLSLYDKKSHDIPIVRRAILRYALSCPKKKAAAFVAQLRKTDASLVEEMEELLKLEAAPKK